MLEGFDRTRAADWVSRATRYMVNEANLRYWELQGLLRRQRPGSRVPANYGVDDLVRLRVVAELRRDGAPLQRVREASVAIRRLLPALEHAGGDWRLAVTAQGDVVRIETDRQAIELTRQPGQFTMLDSVAIIVEAQRAIDQLQAEVAAG